MSVPTSLKEKPQAHTGKRPCEDRVRDRRDSVASHGMQGFLATPGKSGPADILI